ncbi:MAG: ribosome silencing factor [Opitutae bacterium]|nr:ribosome silencing factor [Opitutae bacterium]
MKAKKSKPARKTAPKPAAKPAPRRKANPSLRLLTLLVAALDAKKAEELRVLNVGKLSSITDYLVLATGTSEPHLRALRIEAERVLDGEKTRILGVETTQGSGWTVIDAFDVMVHLFTPENRGKYRMEQLWKDAEEVPLGSLRAE